MTSSPFSYSQALEELQRLSDLGAISAEEFDKRKASVLDRIVNSAGLATSPSHKGAFDAATPRLLGKDHKFGPPERPYRIERVLGQGSFGVVYQAEDVKDSEPGKPAWVALKVLNREVAADDLAASQVKQEARRVSQLTHENIVRVHGWAEDPVGGPPPTPFMVMEYLEGETLAKWLARRRDEGLGSVSLSEAQDLLNPMAAALDYAAGKKVIHRDIKPNNIFLAKKGDGVTVKVLDFGLAATLRDSGSVGSSNGQQLSSGANGYRPPEWNARRKEWKASYDVYSLAVLLYQLLDAEHQLPYAEHQPEVLPDPPDGLSDAQWEVLQRGLAYSADKRIASAGELLRQIESAEARNNEAEQPQAVAPQAHKEHENTAATAVEAMRQADEKEKRPEEDASKQQKLDAWNKALRANTVEALENFLKAYPQSACKSEAEARITELKKAPAESLLRPVAKVVALVGAIGVGYVLIGIKEEAPIARESSVALAPAPVAQPPSTVMKDEAEAKSRAKALAETEVQRARLEQNVKDLQTAAARKASAAPVFVASVSTPPSCTECPELVAIPAGSFQMGSPEGEAGRLFDEGPQHRVSVPAFWMGKYEVTQGQWKAVMGSNPSRFKDCGDDCPVENVSWDDVQVYLDKLNERTGKAYRLPSEAEWEYAARAGTSTPFYTGHCVNTAQANYDGKYDYNNCGAKTGVYREKTIKVGSFAANAYGLHDMIGNVTEWTQDCANNSYSGAPRDGRPWTSGDCGQRSQRGASWLSYPEDARSANRNSSSTGFRYEFNGFRVAFSAAGTLP